MQTIGIDIETYSSADLKSSGVYKYTEAADFEIMLFAYSIDGGPVQVLDLTLDDYVPAEVMQALTDPAVLKTAFNANFERTCIAKHFGIVLPAEQWECTMVKASMIGLPLSLDAVAKVLQLTEEKNAEGKALIRYFSIPCKPTKANGLRTRNPPEHAPDKWERFCAYCAQDVRVEQEIRNAVAFFDIPAMERELWALDQRINDTGVLLDPVFVKNAISQDIEYKNRLVTEALALTGLDNPNSPTQLKDWLTKETGVETTSLKKGDIPALLEASSSDTVTRVLQIRQELSKTSVKKYVAMRSVACADSRVRGLLQFYGANRTGRWAGRLVQVQNLPRNKMKSLDLARQVVADNDLDLLELLFGNVPDTLSQLIRTSFVAPARHRFIVADFSAIEARVIAWLAGERWRMDVFNSHGKIYEASAAQMFKVPIESVTKDSDFRQRGKVAELALGYQGGPNALIAMGALDMGLEEDELPKLVKMWRNANKAIVALWYAVEDAAVRALQGEQVTLPRGLTFYCRRSILFIKLPSGRLLSYLRAKLVPNKFGGESIQYEGMNQTTKTWGLQDTYGGKLVENIVQAVARDCLGVALLRMYAAGYKIVMHVHDEIVCEVPDGFGSLEQVNAIMAEPISWAPGLPLKADSYETNYYKKD
jgi:DNA polymerase